MEPRTEGQNIVFIFTEGPTDAQGTRELLRATARVAEAAKQPSKRVFLTRAIQAVATLAEKGEPLSLEAAATAPSDWDVLARAMGAPEIVEAASGVDPLAGARARGLQMKRALMTAEGGTMAAPRVAELLGISRQAVDKRRQAGKLLAVSLGRRGYQYPVWQFGSSGVVEGLERTLHILSVADVWTQIAFFVSHNDRLGGRSALEALRDGDLDGVARAARAYGEQGPA